MARQTTGRAALVANNLPSAKTVTGATNATPIVVTTSAAHGLQTNEVIYIENVGGNGAANGFFIAQVVSSTAVALTSYPGGTNVAGTGSYTSGGTLQSFGYGVTVPVPVDLTEDMRVGTVNVPHEAALDRLAWLVLHAKAVGSNALLNTIGAGFQGDPDDANDGTFKLYGSFELIDNGSSVGKVRLGANTQIVADDVTAFVKTQCRKRFLRPRVPQTGTLSDANHSIDVSQGDRFVLGGAPAATRTITVTKATGAPEEGETMMVMWISVQEGSSNSTQYEFKRDDGTIIATAVTNGATTSTSAHRWVEFEYCLISTGPNVYDWRLGPNSGMGFDGTADYGIVPGGGA